MIKKGYVISENGFYRATVPVYTPAQYDQIISMAKEYTTAELEPTIHELEATAARVLRAHTTKHLTDQVPGIASNDALCNTVGIPATILIERHFLSTVWHPCEMPTTFLVLNK